MPTHRVAGERGAARVDGFVRCDQSREFFRDIGIHPVVILPGRLRRIDVEAGATSEIPIVVLAGQVESARAGVRGDEGEPEFCGATLRAGLHRDVFFGAGEA